MMTTALSGCVAELIGKKAGDGATSRMITKAKSALKITEDTKDLSEAQKDRVVAWVRNSLEPTPCLPEADITPTQTNSESVPQQITTKSGKVSKKVIDKNGNLIIARTSNVVKRGRRVDITRSALTVSKGKVVNIYLEDEFHEAADRMAGLNKGNWFKDVINSNSEMNPTAALRVAIVKALLELFPTPKKQS